MKKKQEPTSLTISLSGIRLFRDDIEHIIQLMKEHSFQVTLSDSSNDYDSLDDFIDHRGIRPTEFQCSAVGERDPYQRIEFSVEDRHRARLNDYSHTREHTPWDQLKELLDQNAPWDYRAASPVLWGLLASFVVPLDLLLLDLVAGKKLAPLPTWFHWLVLILPLIWLLTLLHRRLNFGLILRKRHEGGFWKRNGERIGMLLIGAIIGTIITTAANLLLGIFTRQR